MAHAKDPTTPAPSIGKIGPYTVFLTPPPTPKPDPTPVPVPAPVYVPQRVSPPVQPPPVHYPKPHDRFAFLRHAVTKVQNAHASVDEYMANWLGLDQSKYQWALNDYYETKGVEKGDVLTKGVPNKSQTV